MGFSLIHTLLPNGVAGWRVALISPSGMIFASLPSVYVEKSMALKVALDFVG